MTPSRWKVRFAGNAFWATCQVCKRVVTGETRHVKYHTSLDCKDGCQAKLDKEAVKAVREQRKAEKAQASCLALKVTD